MLIQQTMVFQKKNSPVKMLIPMNMKKMQMQMKKGKTFWFVKKKIENENT